MKKVLLLMVAIAAMWCVSCSKDDDDDKNLLNGDDGEGVITMVTEMDCIQCLWIYSFKEGETITVDWGDGNVFEYKTYADYDRYNGESRGYWAGDLVHLYINSSPHTIKIKGNIKEIDCGEFNLISLDVSECTALTCLDCYANNLTSLNVSKNIALTVLNCDRNALTSLDLSKNTALNYLNCHLNNLTSLDVSGCAALESLLCFRNDLTSLDVSGCTALTRLSCSKNELSADDLNKIFNNLPQGKILDEFPYQSSILIDENPGSETCDRSIAENKGWEVDTY